MHGWRRISSSYSLATAGYASSTVHKWRADDGFNTVFFYRVKFLSKYDLAWPKSYFERTLSRFVGCVCLVMFQKVATTMAAFEAMLRSAFVHELEQVGQSSCLVVWGAVQTYEFSLGACPDNGGVLFYESEDLMNWFMLDDRWCFWNTEYWLK